MNESRALQRLAVAAGIEISFQDNWGEEHRVGERYQQMEMKVRERTEGAKVVMREHFCPGCAMSLGVDVATEELETLVAPALRGTAVPA